jgi:hypothetical protein
MYRLLCNSINEGGDVLDKIYRVDSVVQEHTGVYLGGRGAGQSKIVS